MRISSLIIFHLSKLWNVEFFVLFDVILLVRLQRKFEIDHYVSENNNSNPNNNRAAAHRETISWRASDTVSSSSRKISQRRLTKNRLNKPGKQ